MDDDPARYRFVGLCRGLGGERAFLVDEQVIREALHLFRSIDLEEAYTSDELRAAWQAGIDSGDAGGIDFEELKKEARSRLDR